MIFAQAVTYTAADDGGVSKAQVNEVRTPPEPLTSDLLHYVQK
jgi:hypothetical protein